MEKWLVILGIWAMCATCAVLFIRGATANSGKRVRAEEDARAASRGAPRKTRAALND